VDEYYKKQNTNKYDVLAKILKIKQTHNSTVYLINSSYEVRLDNLIGNYIHMLINRVFQSRQRFYKLVIYNFLRKYYELNLIKNSLSINTNF